MTSTFVTIKKHQFEESLSEMFSDEWSEISNLLNGTREAVYEIKSDQPNISVRIYSSIDIMTKQSRDIGDDAIRVVLWDKLNDRPLGKTKRINRTQGATSVYDRIQKRIKKFLSEEHRVDPIDWDYVKAVLNCNRWSNFAVSLLENLETYGTLTPNQLKYVLGSENINGKPTLEMRAKRYYPNFFTEQQSEPINDTSNQNNSVITQTERDYIPSNFSIYDSNIRDNVSSATSAQNLFPAAPGQEYPQFPEPELFPTTQYLDYNYPFDYFNPVQSAVLPLRLDDINLVIGASTSSGKTICAELMMDSTLNAGKKVIYLSPLKSLTQEKYDDWQVRFADKKIVILTGDYTLSETTRKKLNKADIVVMTSEMMDSRTRRMKMEQGYWLLDVGLVIVDESHIISTDRGHAVEVGLMRFTKINFNARVILLSATMPNVEDMGRWISLLNGKRTEVINTTWRPVELEINAHTYEIIRYQSGGLNYVATQNIKINMAVKIARKKMNEKYLIFVHDKTTGRKIVNALNSRDDSGEFFGEPRDSGNPAVFHNADLNLEDRLEIECGFENRGFTDGVFEGTRVIVSTSTLAWGRNLPARNVIIVGVHRGLQEVDEYDLIQMAGRAGRYGFDDKGFVSLLLPEDGTGIWLTKFYHPRPLQSTLSRPETLAFHVISEIDTGEIKNADSLKRWYSRSFAHQEQEMETNQARNIFETLISMEMIEIQDLPRPKVTGLGKVCSWLYFSPFDVYGWYKNISDVISNGLLQNEPDVALSYSLSNIPSFDFGYIPKDCKFEIENVHKKLRRSGLNNRLLDGTAAYFLGVLTSLEGREKELIPISALTAGRAVKWDIRRITQALKLIDSMHANWELEPIWKSLPLRIKYGVSHEISELCRVPGIGGMRAKKLWNKGFHTIESIADPTKIKKLRLILQPTLAKKIQAAARDTLSEIN